MVCLGIIRTILFFYKFPRTGYRRCLTGFIRKSKMNCITKIIITIPTTISSVGNSIDSTLCISFCCGAIIIISCSKENFGIGLAVGIIIGKSYCSGFFQIRNVSSGGR